MGEMDLVRAMPSGRDHAHVDSKTRAAMVEYLNVRRRMLKGELQEVEKILRIMAQNTLTPTDNSVTGST